MLCGVRSAKVGGQVYDELSVHNKIIVGLLQIPGKHFYNVKTKSTWSALVFSEVKRKRREE